MHPKYITDEQGNKVSVLLSIKEFNAILEDLEELDDIRMYDEVKTLQEPSVPIDEAFKQIETSRKKK
ncbi:MAG: hypothetical protein JNL95_06275 [Chitinophagales bacterium]|nr:hypothetical protein [Chitinophagales bacterium]